MRSSTSGSCAAGRMVVWPSASVAASIAFSVPMTDTNGKRDLGAAQPAGRRREVVAVAVLDRGAERAHRVDVQVDRPAADPVAARVADDHPAEAGQERAEQDEAGAHLGRGLERARTATRRRPRRSRRCSAPAGRRRPRGRGSVSAMTRTSSISGTFVKRQRSPVSVAAAMSFRAAFFAPLIGTVPCSGWPPSTRKSSRVDGFRVVLPVERPRVSHAGYPRCRGPSR